MRPGREIDTRIAKEVFGFKVWAEGKILHENAPLGDRPLRKYSKEIEWAMEVAKHMRISFLPIKGGEWFAFIGPEGQDGWESPNAMLEYLNAGQFDTSGAAVNADLPLAICEAALAAAEKRRKLREEKMGEDINAEPQPPELKVVEPTPDSLH